MFSGFESDFESANLENADMRESNFRDSVFKNSNLHLIKASNADFGGVIFDGSNMTYADLNFTDLTDASLKGVDLQFSDLTGAIVDGTDFSGAKWYYTVCPDGTNSGEVRDCF